MSQEKIEELRKRLTYTIARAQTSEQLVAVSSDILDAAIELFAYDDNDTEPHPDSEVSREVMAELESARTKFNADFDDKNTANDWVCYITSYAASGFTWPFNSTVFRKAMLKVAGLAISAIHALDRNNGSLACRHYDVGSGDRTL